jgi:hypothetical protein
MSSTLYTEEELRQRVLERAGDVTDGMCARLQAEGFERLRTYQLQGQLQEDGSVLFDPAPFMAECKRETELIMHAYVEALLTTLFDVDYEPPAPRLRLLSNSD